MDEGGKGGNAVRLGVGLGTATPAPAPASTANDLTLRHFTRHRARPDHLGEIAPGQLDSFLRCLLFTDGTVTRTLEVETLSGVAVNVIGQGPAALGEEAAEHLEASTADEAVRRRVTIGPASGAAPAIWAESHILPERLPGEFLAVLDGSRDGIGGSLQRFELESWREMLWYGLDEPPEWSFVAPRAPSPVLTRLYRVISGGRPALLIAESFAIEQSGERYRLRWPE